MAVEEGGREVEERRGRKGSKRRGGSRRRGSMRKSKEVEEGGT